MTRPTRLAWTAAAIVMTGAAGLACTTLLADDSGVQVGDIVGAIVLIGGPPAVATWLAVRHTATTGVGRAWAALRTGWTGTGLLVAAFVGAGLAATTLVSSRASLTGDRAGPLFFVIVVVTPVVLLAVTCGIGYARASFWSGVGVGVLAVLAALVGIVAVAMPEGARWAETAGVFILDGDAPVLSPSARDGALDALQSTLVFGPSTWLPWPVIGAALGAALRRWMSIATAPSRLF
jgi:hypothetical protein